MKLSEALEYKREWHQPPILDDVEAARALEAHVAELEAAITKHRDGYIFSSSDFGDIELWKTIPLKP